MPGLPALTWGRQRSNRQLLLYSNDMMQRFAELAMGNSRYSPGGAFRLTLQATDGNMVLQIMTIPHFPCGSRASKWTR
jgi:hypothetical protein